MNEHADIPVTSAEIRHATETMRLSAERIDELEAERQQAEERAEQWRSEYNEQVQRWSDAMVQRQQAIEALREIAGPSPRSQRHEVDQLRDAVKWRQGIARDALAKLGEPQP